MKCNATPYEGSEPFAFISYCHADEAIVYPYIEMLAKRGYRVWYDEGINPGDEWPEVIAKHLDESTYFIAFISENSIASHNCKREVNFAIQKRKAFMAVFLEEVKLSLGLEMALSTVQALKRDQFKTHEECLRQICKNKVLNWCKGEENLNIVIHDIEEDSVCKKVNNVENCEENESYSYDRFFKNDCSATNCLDKDKINVKYETIVFNHDKSINNNVNIEKANYKFEKSENIENEKQISTKYENISNDNVKSKNSDSDNIKRNVFGQYDAEKQIQYFDEDIISDDYETVIKPIEENETVLNPGSESYSNTVLKDVLIKISSNDALPIIERCTTIGRSVNDDYTIEDDKSIISRKHITIVKEKECIFVIDNKSKNQTRINGKVIESDIKIRINDCDIIEIGDEKLIYISNNENKMNCEKTIMYLKNDNVEFKVSSKLLTRIGRNEKSNDIVIKNNKISRNHALIVCTNKNAFVIDLNSSNGTYLNDKRVHYGERGVLHSGDNISFGSIKYMVI